MRLLVGIPALNEAATIAEVVGAVPRDLQGFDAVEVLVVDDGSSDDTSALAQGAGATVVRHRHNQGVGVAFHSMVRHALATGADLLVTIDGDGQFDPSHIGQLVAPILDGRSWVATASRFADPALVPNMPWVKKWGNARVAGLVSRMTGRRYADVSCGFRAYHRQALLRLTVHHAFTYTHETFIDLAVKGIPFVEVPLKVRGEREHGKSRVAASVLRYGGRTALIMLRTYRDYRPLQVFVAAAVPLIVAGIALMAWSLLTFRATGSWLKWAAFTGAAGLGVAVLLIFSGFLADMATRLRLNQEEILYWLRRRGGPPVEVAGGGQRGGEPGQTAPQGDQQEQGG